MNKSELRALAASAALAAPVRKIETGVSLNLSPSDWRDIVRGSRVDSAADAIAAEHRAERRAELAHDFAFVGDHQAAMDALTGAFDRD